jgi:signal transduction histidine kinase
MSSISILQTIDNNRRFNKNTSFDVGVPDLLFTSQTRDLQRAKSQQLETSSLANVGRMAYFISHDLCNYLSAVNSNVEFLSDSKTTLSDRKLLSAEVRAAIHCMKDQLDSLLLFARTGSPVHMCSCSLNQLIQHAVRMVRQHPDASEVKIVTGASTSVKHRADAKRLGSAIYNLLLNACQAAKQGPVARAAEVTLRQENNLIFIRFIDTGPGVPSVIRETLFQPFVSEGKPAGIGLGLTIAARVAREHGGDLYLEESRPGRTVFVLRFSRTALVE